MDNKLGDIGFVVGRAINDAVLGGKTIWLTISNNVSVYAKATVRDGLRVENFDGLHIAIEEELKELNGQ